ncbi:MAG: putative DNA binding domain-containing protein [Roseburia sp.]|nr:putative DNA binding domain-containing protein [Roseburia sp.]MCM1243724.1 putative DNA binding domain-containing protein [Roseburia sp.]
MILPSELMQLIKQGEGLTVEFKKSTTKITKDVYDTVCSFSNRDGGHIFLGVKDNGTICGINMDCVEQIKKDFVTTINNGSKIYSPLYLELEQYEVDGRIILYIYVPIGKTVYRTTGRIFDRNNESDIDITDNADMVFNLYARKQNTYFVNKVYPAFSVSSLRHDLIERARRMARAGTDWHPWTDMTDEEMLRSCGLLLEDSQTNQTGITLAAILLFGTDSMIMSVLPQHKTDAVFRVYNVDRYDDRDVVITNLIESYDRLIAFGQKHLNDVFVMEGVQRISARDKILREIVSNLLMHRDFSSGFVPKMLIEQKQIVTENANLSHGHGNLNLKTFKPFAKNPPIAKLFREIGLADELGSGMRNSYKYTKLYSGAEPAFTEGDVFTIVIPLSESSTATVGPLFDRSNTQVSTEVSTEVTTQVKLSPDKLKALLDFCNEARSSKQKYIRKDRMEKDVLTQLKV